MVNRDLKNRVAVTGLGIISCLGNNIQSVSGALKEGKAGYGIDPERVNLGFRSPVTGMINNFDPKQYLDRKKRKTMFLSTIWAYAATEQAIKDSGLSEDAIQSTETGIIFGHDSVAQPSYEAGAKLLEEKVTKNLGSGSIFQIMNSTVTMNLSTILKNRGANWSISAACASSSHAIGQAADLIRNGHQEIVIAGGAQEINWHAMASFDALGAFAIDYETPQQASRPFDQKRSGLVPSGGAAAVILERMDLALARGATIYGEIVAYSFSADGDDMSAPNGQGAKIVVDKVLKQAEISSREIDYINAHATSTPRGDKAEAQTIYEIFGDHPYVSSTKSMTGHECWMAGASEIIYCLIMMKENFIAPNINFVQGDEITSRINIVTRKMDFNPQLVLSNSFGFGGTNSAIILKNFKD